MITGYTRCYIPSKVHMPCMPVNFQTVNWSFSINFTYPCTIFQITRPPLQSNQLECSRQICIEKQFHFFRLTIAGLRVTQWNAAWYFAVSMQSGHQTFNRMKWPGSPWKISTKQKQIRTLALPLYDFHTSPATNYYILLI